jgi:hypothetical protein
LLYTGRGGYRETPGRDQVCGIRYRLDSTHITAPIKGLGQESWYYVRMGPWGGKGFGVVVVEEEKRGILRGTTL